MFAEIQVFFFFFISLITCEYNWSYTDSTFLKKEVLLFKKYLCSLQFLVSDIKT